MDILLNLALEVTLFFGRLIVLHMCPTPRSMILHSFTQVNDLQQVDSTFVVQKEDELARFTWGDYVRTHDKM